MQIIIVFVFKSLSFRLTCLENEFFYLERSACKNQRSKIEGVSLSITMTSIIPPQKLLAFLEPIVTTPISFFLVKPDAGNASLPACHVLLAVLANQTYSIPIIPKSISKKLDINVSIDFLWWRTAAASDLLKGNCLSQQRFMTWGCTNTYCGEWKHFEFEKNFDFQTIHIRDFLLSQGFLKSSKDKLRLKDVNQYLMEKLKLKDKPCTKRADVPSVWDALFPKLNCK